MSSLNVVVCKWDPVALPAIVERAERVFLVVDEFDVEHQELDPRVMEHVERCYRVRTFDALDEIAGVAADLRLAAPRIDRVASTAEYSQYGAGALAHLLGAANYSLAVAHASRDKRWMKALVRQAGVRVADFASVPPLDGTDPARLERELGLPLMLKPAAGLGSIGAERLDERAELERALAAAAAEPFAAHRIAERFVHGEEFWIDAVWRDGEPWLFEIGHYLRPRLEIYDRMDVNGGHLLPRAEHLDFYERVLALQRKANAALGIANGATHLEVFLEHDTDELYFSEIATRWGGGAGPHQVKVKHGMDIREIWAHEVCGGAREDLRLRPSPFPHVGYLNIVPEHSGVLVDGPSDAELSEHPLILDHEWVTSVGQRIDLAHPSVWCLLVVVGAETREGLLDAMREVRDFAVLQAA